MLSGQQGKKIVLAVSGASGAIYARRLLEQLLISTSGCQVHIVFTAMARRIMKSEQGVSYQQLQEQINNNKSHTSDNNGNISTINDNGRSNIFWYDNDDMFSVLASGSFLTDGMVICPCSSHCLASVAGGMADTLLLRRAYISLKQRERLILVHREMPLSSIDMENMLRISQAGGIICPASPAFYMKPQSINDIVDTVVARVLDLLGVRHNLVVRWMGKE